MTTTHLVLAFGFNARIPLQSILKNKKVVGTTHLKYYEEGCERTNQSKGLEPKARTV
jgi:hypothetical protein